MDVISDIISPKCRCNLWTFYFCFVTKYSGHAFLLNVRRKKYSIEIVIQSINLRVEDKNKINHLATLRVFRNNNTFFFFFLNSAHWFLINPHTHTRAERPERGAEVTTRVAIVCAGETERRKKVRIDWISSHTRSLSVLQQSTFEWFQWSNRIRARVVFSINFIDSDHESNILLCYV